MGQAAFDALATPHLRELRAHCYRLSGSLADAEDLLQETLLKAWSHRDQYQGRASFKAWLYRIATNAYLDRPASHRARSLPQLETPAHRAGTAPGAADEALWLEPFPDSLLPPAASAEGALAVRESIGLAFLAAIQRIPARQRAILLLREVVGMSAEEVASLLDSSVAAVNSALQRAREAVSSPIQQRAPDEAERDVLRRYISAWEQADAQALVALLREDATLSMPPMPMWLSGAQAIGAFFGEGLFAAGAGAFRGVPTRSNGRPTAALYMRTPRGGFAPLALVTLAVAPDGRISELDSFVLPSRFAHFELPMSLDD